MEKVKEIFGKVVSWIDTKGFSALASLGIGIAFGVFLTRNWDLLRGLVTKK